MIDTARAVRLIESYDPAAHVGEIQRAETQRAAALDRFPKEGWPTLALDDYALGQSDHPDNFCRWMEFVADELGSIRGGSARKHLIYFQAGVGEWWFEKKLYSSVEEAWIAVQQGFVDAIAAGAIGDWGAVEAIPALRAGPALVCKTMHLYYPTEILPINSSDHLRRFLRGLGEPRVEDHGLGTISLNRLLLEGLRAVRELDGLTTKELERLLYTSELDPFAPPVIKTPIPNVAAFIRDTLLETDDDCLGTRREAEDQARRLLDDHAGHMTEDQVRELLRLFNADFYNGKRVNTRFAPGFVGHIANGLVAHLAEFNDWTARIWRGSDDESSAAVRHLIVDHKALPSAGISYPTMLAYLRAPEDACIWIRATDSGLRRLTTYSPRKPSPGDPDDYPVFCGAASQLTKDYDIPPEFLDLVLAAAGNYKPVEAPEPQGSRVWLFQANPAKYDIDSALAELAEISWVVRQYRSDIQIGDRAYLWKSGPDGGVVATATVASEPEISAEDDDRFVLEPGVFSKPELRVLLRVVDVLPQPIRRSDLLEHPILKKLGVITFANATNFAVTADQDAALLALLEGRDTPDVALPDATEDLAASVFVPKAWLDDVVDLLRAKRQLIFYGPPGTGKTFLAQEIAKDITRDGGEFVLVQFHPSYSYEDFIEGYRPFELDGGAGLGYRLTHGPLRRIATAASANPSRPYVLIVDELNRGNVPKIFGELLFLLEYRDKAIALQYSADEPFSLPRNLYVIGTMNTADRSIALVDAALRRRFYFVPFAPEESPFCDVLRKWLAKHGLGNEPALLMDALNQAIADHEIAIGPSYFMGQDGTVPDLERVWKYAIMPLLEEHFYGTGRNVSVEFGLAALAKRVHPPEQDLPEEPPSTPET